MANCLHTIEGAISGQKILPSFIFLVQASTFKFMYLGSQRRLKSYTLNFYNTEATSCSFKK